MTIEHRTPCTQCTLKSASSSHSPPHLISFALLLITQELSSMPHQCFINAIPVRPWTGIRSHPPRQLDILYYVQCLLVTPLPLFLQPNNTSILLITTRPFPYAHFNHCREHPPVRPSLLSPTPLRSVSLREQVLVRIIIRSVRILGLRTLGATTPHASLSRRLMDSVHFRFDLLLGTCGGRAQGEPNAVDTRL